MKKINLLIMLSISTLGLFACANPNESHSITYHLDGGTNSINNPSSYIVGSSFNFDSPSKTGYNFAGWFDDNNIQILGVNPNTRVDLSLTAHWSALLNELLIKSEDNSKGTVRITSGSGYSDESIVVTAKPAVYTTFDGWYQDQDKVSDDLSYSFTMPTHDYSLTAHFKINEERAIKFGAEPHLSNDGKSLTYGLYPQTHVNDPSLLIALNQLVNVDTNGYYFYNDNYYAKVVASPNKNNYKFSNGTAIVSGTLYWFKCEPIKWDIIDVGYNIRYLLASQILDVHTFYDSQEQRVIDNYLIYPNNYEYSSMRSWLNNDFYNQAFALNSYYIINTEVNNSGSSTHYEYTSYASNNTNDNVFLLSYQDYLNSDYGFITTKDLTTTRRATTTDWARARGAYYSTKSAYQYNGSYWTRSPDTLYNSTYNSWVVTSEGAIGFDPVDCQSDGVRPSINITKY